MLNYYKEKIAESEEKLRLAKIGYQSEMHTIGVSLLNTKTYEETDLVFIRIKKIHKAIELLESEVQINKQRYAEEANEPENKKAEAEKTLFGGNE